MLSGGLFFHVFHDGTECFFLRLQDRSSNKVHRAFSAIGSDLWFYMCRISPAESPLKAECFVMNSHPLPHDLIGLRPRIYLFLINRRQVGGNGTSIRTGAEYG